MLFQMELRKEREAVVRHKKEFMMVRQHNEVKQMLERQVTIGVHTLPDVLSLNRTSMPRTGLMISPFRRTDALFEDRTFISLQEWSVHEQVRRL